MIQFEAFLQKQQAAARSNADYLGSAEQLDLIRAFVAERAPHAEVRWLLPHDDPPWSHFHLDQGRPEIIIMPPGSADDVERAVADVLHETLHAAYSTGEMDPLFRRAARSLAEQLHALRQLRDVLEDERVMRRAVEAEPLLANACNRYRDDADRQRLQAYEQESGAKLGDPVRAVPILQLPIAVARFTVGSPTEWAHENVQAVIQQRSTEIRSALGKDKAAVEALAVHLLAVFVRLDGEELMSPHDSGATSADERPSPQRT